MTTTITFRIESNQRDKLRQKAKLLGKTESEFIRNVLHRELEEGPLATFVGQLKGSLSLTRNDPDPWRRNLKARNWRR